MFQGYITEFGKATLPDAEAAAAEAVKSAEPKEL
jgi:hypothetical protein